MSAQLKLFLATVFFGLAGCGSTVESPSDNPSDDSEIQAETSVSDFEDESLFDPGDTAAIDTGEEDPPPVSEPVPEPTAKAELDKQAEEEQAKSELPKTLPPKEPSTGKFKAATRKTKSDCNMRSQPSVKSKKLTMISKGRKIWTEPHSDKWFKVYRKKGVAYVSSACF